MSCSPWKRRDVMQTDSKDAKILDILKKNSRESFSVIGGQTGLSETAVRRRVKHMQSTGTITKFTVEHDDINSTKAIVLVSVDSTTDTSLVSKKLKKLPDIRTVYEIMDSMIPLQSCVLWRANFMASIASAPLLFRCTCDSP